MKFVTVAVLGIVLSQSSAASRGRHSTKTREHLNKYIDPPSDEDLADMYYEGVVIRKPENAWYSITSSEIDSNEESLSDLEGPIVTGIAASKYRSENNWKPPASVDEALTITSLNYKKKTNLNK